MNVNSNVKLMVAFRRCTRTLRVLYLLVLCTIRSRTLNIQLRSISFLLSLSTKLLYFSTISWNVFTEKHARKKVPLCN
jgi:hypothetical protein